MLGWRGPGPPLAESAGRLGPTSWRVIPPNVAGCSASAGRVGGDRRDPDPARIVALVVGDFLPYDLVMVAGRPPAGFD
jgi:hypothetical protein